MTKSLLQALETCLDLRPPLG